MSPANKVKLMFLQELSDFISSKSIGNTPIILTPSLDVPIRISPEKVTQESLVRHVGRALYGPDLVQIRELGGQTSMHAEDLVVDDRSHGQAVEAFGVDLPQTDAEPALAFVVEAVDAVD